VKLELAFYRLGHALHGLGLVRLGQAVALLTRVFLGAYVPASCRIGTRTKLAYGGAGVVIHPRAVIGDRCVIAPGVVVGGRGGPAVPEIGNDVQLHAGAKVLGGVVVGDGAIIGVNAVVIADVPAGSTAVAPLARLLH
jgi:serine O-acetyltransferase